MSFKAVLSSLTVAAFASRCLAAPIDASDISIVRRDNSTTSGPALALQPAVAPVASSTDQQVVPQTSLKLHYSGSVGNASDTTSATVDIPKLTHPVINAAGAASIKTVVCNGGQAHVTFTDLQAYNKAASTWSANFLLVTYSQSCGTGLNGEHDFLLVDSIASKSPESLSIVVAAIGIDVASVVDQDTIISVKVGSPVSNVQARDTTKTSGPKHLGWTQSSNKQLASSGNGKIRCIDCGTSGDLQLTASVDYSATGLQDVKASLIGFTTFNGVFGLSGTGQVTIPVKDVTIAAIPLGGIAVGSFLELGPVFKIDADGKLSLKASGSLELGAQLGAHVDASMEADFRHKKYSATRGNSMDLTYRPHYKSSGSLGATLDIGLTASLELTATVKIIKKFSETIAVRDRTDFVVSGERNPKSCNPGVEIKGNIANRAYFDVLGHDYELFKVTGIPLDKCFKKGSKGAAALADASADDSDDTISADLPVETVTADPVTLPNVTATGSSVSVSTSYPSVRPTGTTVRIVSTVAAAAARR